MNSGISTTVRVVDAPIAATMAACSPPWNVAAVVSAIEPRVALPRKSARPTNMVTRSMSEATEAACVWTVGVPVLELDEDTDAELAARLVAESPSAVATVET